jgi:hypothetical protein
MITRREVLISGLIAPWLSGCGGSGADGNMTPQLSGGATALPDQGTYGTMIANWDTLVMSAGSAKLDASAMQPPHQSATNLLRLGQNSNASFGEQGSFAGMQPYLPRGREPGFSAALWVANPNARTLNFELRLFDVSARRSVRWNCAVDPTNGWIFLTLSPTQQVSVGWSFGTDSVNAVRILQQDKMAEGPWLPGEFLLFGSVYVDVSSRPLFMITFDDGNDTQRNASHTPIVSGPAYVKSSHADTLTTAANHNLVEGEPIIFTDIAPIGLSLGEQYWVSTVPDLTSFTLSADESLTSHVHTEGFAGVANYRFAGIAGRSGQQIVESHGFKGSLFLVPSWLGTLGRYGYGRRPKKFMSAADAQAMHADGWSIGSHTNTHPSNLENAGLRLLGPYGYFLSNPVDNLPASYVATWRLGNAHRRRAANASAGTNIISFENPHMFLGNMPIVFTDDAPSGLTVGTVYYCQSIPTASTATFATDQGSLVATAVITADWSGLANYRFARASSDDSAIYADIQDGVDGLLALGITTAQKFFALPQGAADEYVRSACVRAKLGWIRGASIHAHTIPAGKPSGGGLSGIALEPGGWLAQPDCAQTDGAVSPSIREIRTYLDETISQGACGCSYHHDVIGGNISNLEDLCLSLRMKVDANAIDVVTLDEMADRLKV